MIIVDRTSATVDLRLNRDELGLLGNALNEVCNGVEIADFEFQTRLGVERSEAQALLRRVRDVYRSVFKVGDQADQ
jgi:hypothetical protein